MLGSEEISKLIEAQGEKILGKIIKDAIEDNKQKAQKMQMFYNRYAGEVPIKKRRNPDKSDISLNNKINNDYEGLIIDQIKGYIWGRPITTSYEGDNKDNIELLINDFKAANNMDSLDEESGEYSCACGFASRLCYIDTDGQIRIMNIKPWQTIFFYNNSTDDLDYAMIYYDWIIVDAATGRVKKTIRVEWYDKAEITYFIKDGTGYSKEQSGEPGYLNPQIHTFDYVPLIKIKGNNLEQSDIEKAEAQIDGYNELISDAQNELQEFVHAYLKAIGAEISEEERLKARSSRVFNLPDKDADISFITKDVNPVFFENQKTTLDQNIYKSTKTVNMNDEKFTSGGAESGEGRKWKLLALEFKAASKEKKFIEAMRMQYKIIGSAWNKKDLGFNYLHLKYTFTRNLPVDYLYYAQIAQQFKGTLATIDILKLMPFVDNAEAFYQRLQEEQGSNIDSFLTDPATLESQVNKILNSGAGQ